MEHAPFAVGRPAYASMPASPEGAAETLPTELIGAIYDAAIDASRWTEVLEDCRAYVGGLSATIFAKNITGKQGGVYAADGRLASEQSDLYFSRFAPIDPSNTIQVFANLDEAIVTSDLLDLDEFVASRFAKEWARPQGIVDMVVAPIERRGNWAALFGVFRHERDGTGDDLARRRVSLLAPHVRRAVAIADMVGTARSEAASFSEAIDGLAAGVFLVDQEGWLVHVNVAGRRLLGTSGGLSARPDTIGLEGTLLRELLPQASRLVSGSAVIRMPSGDRYVAHVLPLSGGDRQIRGNGADAVAALFVLPAGFEPTSIPEALATAFDLTPSELRVVLATIRHDGAADIAEALGIAEATVRTHLHRIFSKTETRRQADIVKLVAGFSSPLVAR